jgi:diaminopimelate epimerase
VDDVDNVDVRNTGSALGTHSLFPKGASIVFIQVLDGGTVKACLWHPGKGETDFTAEAACVAGVTAMMLHRVQASEVDVRMGQNVFRVEWNRRADMVSLTGPADLL